MAKILPSQYVGGNELGGPTVTKYWQYALNENQKRQREYIDRELDGNRAVKAGKTLETFLVKPQSGLIHPPELLFDGVNDVYYDYVKPDKTKSHVNDDDGESDWIIHFDIHSIDQPYVTNPSWWRLVTTCQFKWYGIDAPQTLYSFTNWDKAKADQSTFHMKPALNAERLMIDEVCINVGEDKYNIYFIPPSFPSSYISQLRERLLYMLKLTMNEKKILNSNVRLTIVLDFYAEKELIT